MTERQKKITEALRALQSQEHRQYITVHLYHGYSHHTVASLKRSDLDDYMSRNPKAEVVSPRSLARDYDRKIYDG